jgi:type IV pilus assembly protein PilM
VILLSQNLICLDLGSQNLHMVHGTYNKGNIVLYNAVNFPLSEGVFRDGKIEDFERLKESIRTLISDNKIKEKNAVLTIQSTSIITRDIMLPAIERQQLDNMVSYEIEQYLPIIATEYVIEYSVAGETVENGVNKYKVQVAAMPKNMVDNFLNLIKELGLKPIALDIHPNTVAKLISQNTAINGRPLDKEKTLAFIDLGYYSINIHIISDGKLAFSRIINLGARDLDNEISITCNLSLEQAEKKKIQDAELDPNTFNDLIPDTFHDLVRAQVDIWLSEIQKIFQYYISRTTGNRIEEIYLYGGSSSLHGLNKYLQQALNLPTSNIDDLNNIKITKNITKFNPRNYINALGGLIRYE